MSSAIIRMKRTEHGTGEVSKKNLEPGVLELAWEDNNDPKLMWTEPSPLMMDPDPQETVTFLHNWVMNVPLFTQRVSSCDFLLFPGSGDVCGIDHQYLAGQVEPRILVIPPTEYVRGGTLALQRYIELTFCWEAYRTREVRLPQSWISERFQGVHPQIVENAIRRVAEQDGAWYVPKVEAGQNPRQALKEKLGNLTMFTTYESCGWDAMERGLARLRRAGIGHGLADSEVREVLSAYQLQLRILRLSYYAGKAVGSPGLANLLAQQKREIAAAKYISREIMRTPWYLSLCFDKLFNNIEAVFNPFPSGTVMQVTGRADPSGRGDMVSFLPDYRKADLGKKYDATGAQVTEDRGGRVFRATSPGEDDVFFECEVFDEEFRPGPQHRKKTNTLYQANEKVKLFGTEADLRKVNMEDLGDILVRIGIPEREVDKVARWDRCWLVDQVASSHLGKTILDGSIAKYSRVHRADDGNISEEVRVRWQLEASSEFRNARARATEAYRKFARFAGMDDFGRKKAWRYRLVDELDRILSEQEEERLDYEKFVSEQASKNASSTTEPVRGPADENELLTWAAAQPAVRGRRMLMRTFIQRMDDGREKIWVEYHVNQDDVEEYEEKHMKHEGEYMARESSECEWEEIEEGEDEYVM
jgi:hypothetical protein